MSSRMLVGVASLLALLSSAALAQQAPQGGPQGPQGGPGGPGGRPDFAQMQKEFLDRTKESLEASDEDWKALEPRIQHVQQLQREASSRGMMFGGPGGGPGGPGGGPGGPRPDAPAANPNNAAAPGGTPNPGQPPQSAIQQATSALMESLFSNDSNPDDVKAKLAAVRDARTKAKAALSAAQEDLRGLLTSRQEAVLVSQGLLD